MALNTLTQSFGSTYANGTVILVDSVTGQPATIMETTTGGVINQNGFANLDSSGNMSVIVDTARTYVISAYDGVSYEAVDELTTAERKAVKASAATGNLGGMRAINAQTGTAYTLALTDGGKLVTMTNASANTVTVPTNAAVPLPVGTTVRVTMAGAGITTIAAAGGVTLVKPSAKSLAISAQYEGASLEKLATNTWLVLAS